MVNSWLRGLAKIKWLVIIIWISAAIAAWFTLPDLGQIVRQTEWRFIPKDAASAQAQQILDSMNPDRQSKSNAIIVLNRDGGLTEQDQTWLKNKISEMNSNQSDLGITGVISQFDDPSLADKFVSQDHTTELLVVELPKEVQVADTADSIVKLKEMMKDVPSGASVEFTGSAPIYIDYSHSAEEGLRKTEILTIILVIVILLIVFRSPIAPFVPLLTIGASFIITRGIVALLTKLGLPVSTFTETFLIAVMFGAGTDYCILLIHRFREELSKNADRVVALSQTVKSVGRTILYAGSTVFIAFFLIGFAKFGLYQSAAGVAVGIAFTLLAAVTLAPAIMLILGPAMFWPVRLKQDSSHRDSKMWGGMNKLATKRPAIVLLVCLVILAPITLLFQGNRSFDDLGEMNKDASAVKGFRTVEAKFSSGEVLPVTAVLTSATSMRSAESIAAIEKVSSEISLLPHVKEVRSVARPLGKQISQLTVPSQLEQTTKAITDIRSGVSQLGDSLKKAQTDMSQNVDNITRLQQNADLIANKMKETQQGLIQIRGGLGQSSQGTQQLVGAASQLEQTSDSMNNDLNELMQNYPDLAKDPFYLGIIAKSQGITGGLTQTKQGLQGISQGISQIAPSVGQISDGLGQLATGQTQIASGVGELKKGIAQFSSGLGEGTSAINQMSDGLGQIAEAQQGIVTNGSKQIAGWYLPSNMLSDNQELQKAVDNYISQDGKIAKIEIVFDINPYSKEAMDSIPIIQSAIKQSVQGTILQELDVKMSGNTATYTELKEISANDFISTGGLMLAGIFIILVILLRSIVMPLYLLLSLAFNYLVTMGILEFIFVRMLGFEGLSWSVSFFLFLVLIALGVDYNIFLMSRFKEEYQLGEGGVKGALSKAMRTTGGVITSAAFIMAGTFAALMPAGVTTLLQLGAGIVIGLFIYSTVMMGLMIPSITVWFGEANWWPLRPNKLNNSKDRKKISTIAEQQLHS